MNNLASKKRGGENSTIIRSVMQYKKQYGCNYDLKCEQCIKGRKSIMDWKKGYEDDYISCSIHHE
jgi:hypothetical protein